MLRDDASAISKQDKGKGTSSFPTFFHHPATAGWDGNNGTFAGAKVWFLSFCVRGQFCEPGPNLETTIFVWKMGKISPPVKNWLFCEKTGKLKLADLLWELEDLAGNRSGIRSCGLLFCWASFGDPAFFIPLNRNFQQIGRFSITEWVRALPVLRLMASRTRCLPLPKEEFLWHAPRRSRTPRKNQLACFCETCDACETGGVYCTVTILPLCTSRLEKVTPKSDNGWRQRFSFCFSTFAVMENPEAA